MARINSCGLVRFVFKEKERMEIENKGQINIMYNKITNIMRKAIMCFVALLVMAAAATGPVRAQSNHTKYTSAVAMSALQVGDTLAEGFSLTGGDANTIYLVGNRHKNNENLFGSQESINLEWIESIGANCVFSTHPYNEDYTTTFAPVDENGRDGDAWVVTEVESIAVFTNITIAGIRIPGPFHTVRLAEGTEDAANWTLASGNASVPGTQVLENVMSGSELTATYSGTRKVKSVKAVKYVVPPTLLDNTTTAWADGKYAVPAGGLTYSDAITVSGDVTLVLTDGETLTLNKGISLASGATLTIQGNGTMNVNGTNESTASTVAGTGTLVLTSGTLTATGGNGGSVDFQCSNCSGGNGGDAISGSVTVNSGTLTATGGNGGSVGNYGYSCGGGAGSAAISGDLTINSGTVTSTNGANGQLGQYTDDCSAGAGCKAVAGTVTDNR